MERKTSKLDISRLSNRGSYNNKEIYQILDEALFCTVSYSKNDEPYSIPTGHVREGNTLYIHGSSKSHFLQKILKYKSVCITASIMDGLVLAKSALNHSFNYRSVVLFSTPELITDTQQKQKIFEIFTNRYLPGRWNDIRKPSSGEIKATSVIAFKISEASAKTRNGPPSETAKDKHLSIWSGIVPYRTEYGDPIPAKEANETIALPEYLKNL